MREHPLTMTNNIHQKIALITGLLPYGNEIKHKYHIKGFVIFYLNVCERIKILEDIAFLLCAHIQIHINVSI
jgi:hypothetical protein